ncbi:MAG: serine/threonine protein kinase [Deltaproteobacteria bacterium]|nr:serine/threonine protein kinase [Deltaproteobacteria bacterium]
MLAYAGFCLAISAVVFFTVYYLGIPWQKFLRLFPGLGRYVRATLFFLPAWSACAILVLLARPWSRGALARLDLQFSFVWLAGLAFLASALFPAQGFLYPYLAILLLHALFAPYFLRIQAALAAATVLLFLGGEIVAFRFLSETQRILMQDSDTGAFWQLLTAAGVYLALVAYLSLEIARGLARDTRRSVLEDHFDNYVIQKFLGTGGMGKVYLATHRAICRPTALKIMEPKAEDFSTAVARFEREVRLCSTLSHPNTVTIFDFGRTGKSTFYYAMESLEGLDLQRWVERFGPMPARRLVPILSQVCASLAEAHQRGIIHRDIKPSNIFLARLGGMYDFVKVLDFGLAKEMNSNGAQLTESHVFLGTPAYVAPEMIVDRKRVDSRTDIYMLGCVAFWALTGRTPFQGDNDAKLILEHVRSLPQWPSELAPHELPDSLERIVMRCLEKRMEDRFSDIGELSAALLAVPLDKPWTQAEARAWWEKHLPEPPAEVLSEECASFDDPKPRQAASASGSP